MSQSNELTLIPKYEKYMQYIIEVIIKMPRTEKFNIGNEFKTIMYKKPIATTTSFFVFHSNTIPDYMFYGIYTEKVLVLKRFIPS